MAPSGSQDFPGQGSPGDWELVVMNLDGSGRKQLTHNQEQEFLPHFSPDGSKLLYTRYTRGGYGVEGSQSRVTVYNFASGSTLDLTDTGKDSYPVWSPDGTRIAFLSMREVATPGNGMALWVMNADGSGAHEIGRPSGENRDHGWGDIAWSSQGWILFVVAENNSNNTCFKTRLDKIRPDGTQRTQVTDGGPHCTPAGMEQNGDADPGFSADGATIFTSRGLPAQPPGIPGGTVRKLFASSSDAWHPGKPEHDLSLASAPNCIEGVPKGSPDGSRVLLFRACAGEQAGITVTDTAGSYRTWIADGFGPDWNPASNQAFTSPQRVTILGYDDHAMEPFVSRDGRYLFFNNLNHPAINTNLHWAERLDDLTFQYRGEIRGVNTTSLEGVASMDYDNVFYFVSPRSYDQTASTLYRGNFADGVVTAVELVPGISTATPGIVNFDAEISADGRTLYFVESQFGPAGPQTADILIGERDRTRFQRASQSRTVMQQINTAALEYAPAISASGLEILFTRLEGNASSIYTATRTSTSAPFDAPRRIYAITGFAEAPAFSPDEKSIYYHKNDIGRFYIDRVTRR